MATITMNTARMIENAINAREFLTYDKKGISVWGSFSTFNRTGVESYTVNITTPYCMACLTEVTDAHITMNHNGYYILDIHSNTGAFIFYIE